jgi:predicted P-loop ATPase
MDNIDKYFVENNPNKRSTTYGKLIGLLEANKEFNDTFTYNMITHNVEYKNKPAWDNDAYAGKEINDTDAIIIKGYLTRKYLVSPNKNIVIDAIIDISMRNKFHPIKDYLNILEFDGVLRLHRFFPDICMTADNAYTQSIGVKMFTALVARIFEPGIKYDQLVVIEGAQGILKSTLIRAIVGKKYFASIGFHQSDQDIIDVFKQMDKDAEEEGKPTITNYLLSLFEAKRRSVIANKWLDSEADKVPDDSGAIDDQALQ